MQSIVFIYYKNNEIKVLGLDDSKDCHIKLVDDGWVHTQTLDACRWIANAFNHCNKNELYENVRELSEKHT